jgi:hypothetical protein
MKSFACFPVKYRTAYDQLLLLMVFNDNFRYGVNNLFLDYLTISFQLPRYVTLNDWMMNCKGFRNKQSRHTLG